MSGPSGSCRRTSLLVLAAALTGPIQAQVVVQNGIRFERLFGSGDPVTEHPPGTTLRFALAPRLAGDWVAALGFSHWNGYGFYVWHDGVFWRIVDSETSLPGLPGTQVSPPDLFTESYSIGDDGTAAFYATVQTSTGAASYRGVWGWREGVLFHVAGTGMAVPGHPGRTFVGVHAPVVDSGMVYFAGHWRDHEDQLEAGVFRYREGEGITLAFAGILVGHPVGEYMAARGEWFIAAGWLEVDGEFSQPRLFRWQDGWSEPEVLYDFSQVSALEVAASAGHAAIRSDSLDPAINGVTRFSPDGAHLVVAGGEPDPHTGQPITALEHIVAIDGLDVAYITGEQFSARIFVEGPDGVARNILGSGDPFYDSEVSRLWQKNQSFDQGRLALGVELASDDASVWLADLQAGAGGVNPLEIPSLSAAAMGVFGGLVALAGWLLIRR